ncbi:MAG: RusA family crossover junction endodeoxyribonuclease [Elusimicrobiota bacterium]
MKRQERRPDYDFFVFDKGSDAGASLARRYRNAVARAARRAIPAPLESGDLTIEIIYSTRADTPQADMDDIIRPTLDALRGVAFRDDSQVRSVTATVFDKDQNATLSKRTEHIGPFLFSSKRHVFLIRIFSASKLADSAGAIKAMQESYARWLRRPDRHSRAEIRGNDRAKVLRKS